ncbi:MAG: hypothetical protein ACI4Q3_01075 [Kiritimatiellia bacterium]
MSERMRKLAIGAAWLVCAAWALPSYGYTKSMYPYEVPAGKQGAALGCEKAVAGMKLELGKWYTNFAVCKKYADDNGLPLFAVWSNEGCVHCWYFDVCLVQDEFVAWQKTSPAAQAILCFMANGAETVDQAGSAAYNWMWYGGGTRLNAYPFVVCWWQKGGVNVRLTGDAMCADENGKTLSLADSTIPARTQNVIRRIEAAFANWTPPAEWAGGTFAAGQSEADRLEAEAGTQCVEVELVRDASAQNVATSACLVVKSPSGATLVEQPVAWTAGQATQRVTIDLADQAFEGAGFEKDGDQLTLLLNDAAGVSRATNAITYVEKATSAANPKWLGEPFGYGEWTMDLDGAKDLVRSQGGYTLVAVQGGLWCPDCANTERNFLNVTNATGANRFEAWAKTNNVALVAVDIPNYTNATATGFSTPTLLSRAAYATRLARPSEYPASGADAAETNYVTRSGLGYLTRKGISDEAAAAQLEKFHALVTANTADGGVHRPEDANKNRTGVPIFALLRADGTVAARLTRFASTSPMRTAEFDQLIKYFDEMLEVSADDSEIENNFCGTNSVALAANNGTATGSLCAADTVDTFRLTGIEGNALQKITVTGRDSSDTGTVTMALIQLVDGKEVALETATDSLKDGFSFEHMFTGSGDYYVKVSSAAIDAGFVNFTIRTDVVLVPQQSAATAQVAGSALIRLEMNAVYLLKGIDAASVSAILESANASDGGQFFKALQTGDFSISPASDGGTIVYRLWTPGTIGFSQTARQVAENTGGTIDVALSRVAGAAGSVTARVSVLEATNLTNRYEFATTNVIWADNDADEKTVTVTVNDDALYDGTGVLVLQVRVVASENDDVPVTKGKGTYTLTVTEDDIQAPGKVLFTGRTEPAIARATTVYARASDGAWLYARRIDGNDGRVGVKMASSVSGVVFEGVEGATVEDGNILCWEHRDSADKVVRVRGIPAGKTARITLSAAAGSPVKVVSASNSVSIVSVADDAPGFVNAANRLEAWRYVAVSNVYPLAAAPSGKVTFTKLSGVLPAGLKAAYDAQGNALALFGTVTAKGGVYTVVYQVKDGTTAGLVTTITIAVSDPTDAKTAPDVANAAVAVSRTFQSLAVIDPSRKRLVGTVQLTIPPRGNLSARYATDTGTVSLSARNWDEFDPATKTLTAVLTSRQGVTMTAEVKDDGSVSLGIVPEEGATPLVAATDGQVWSRTDSAEAWKGYFTVALPVDGDSIVEERASFAPRASGYLTLKMETASAWNAGRVTWAGMLPNGTAVSGSSTLVRDAVSDWAKLPIFKVSSTDVFSAQPELLRDAVEQKETNRRSVRAGDEAIPCWIHSERDVAAGAGYTADLGLYGSVYDKTEALDACCEEFFGSARQLLVFDVSNLGGLSWGTPSAPDSASVAVGANTVALTGAPAGTTLSFNRTTGIVSGGVRLSCADTGKTVSAQWKGVVLTGYGEGCGCAPADETVFLPFVNGTFYFTDRISYDVQVGTRNVTRTLSVRRAGSVSTQSDIP